MFLFSEAENINGVYNNVNLDFDMSFEPNWFEDDFVKRILKEIDKSDCVGGCIIESPVFGPMPPQMLSKSSKALILTYKTDYVTELAYIGDNCVRLLVEISKMKDVYCTCDNPFLSFHDIEDFEAICLNYGEKITDTGLWLFKIYDYADRPEAEYETDITRYMK